jgi:4-diphosphocytidyl-2-C-methyl-D-erythritol kinase
LRTKIGDISFRSVAFQIKEIIMIFKAYAKINIALDVVGKREDGYHLLKMIMQKIELYDLIIVNRIPKDISITCNKEFIPTDDRNLAYKAAALLLEEAGINGGVSIDIKKNIPTAAGLAGGSSDAAAVLRAIKGLYNIQIDNKRLIDIGLKIGADVPYCLTSGTALCEGIGEIITPLKPLKNQILVLVKPSFGVSTKDVYEGLDISKLNIHPNINGLIKAIEDDDIGFIGKNMRNVLENVTLKRYSVLRSIKSEMINHGAIGSMMSGSGPTIFGFFEDMMRAQMCYDKMKTWYKDVFITRTI